MSLGRGGGVVAAWTFYSNYSICKKYGGGGRNEWLKEGMAGMKIIINCRINQEKLEELETEKPGGGDKAESPSNGKVTSSLM